jgi:hypothetical protein
LESIFIGYQQSWFRSTRSAFFFRFCSDLSAIEIEGKMKGIAINEMWYFKDFKQVVSLVKESNRSVKAKRGQDRVAMTINSDYTRRYNSTVEKNYPFIHSMMCQFYEAIVSSTLSCLRITSMIKVFLCSHSVRSCTIQRKLPSYNTV